ncbi:MAG: hypothetical protein KDH96_04120 [Candidatus Riesia sp.]|nr:hypothetical protein [Candidatus Riesia sp.]
MGCVGIKPAAPLVMVVGEPGNPPPEVVPSAVGTYSGSYLTMSPVSGSGSRAIFPP